MEYEIIRDDQATVVRLKGGISFMVADDFNNMLSGVIVKKPRNIVLDMAHVTFVDSTGLGSLITKLNQCEQAEIPLYLMNINRTIQLVFKMSKLDTLFQVLKEEQFVTMFPDIE